jgi:hypothetical protein
MFPTGDLLKGETCAERSRRLCLIDRASAVCTGRIARQADALGIAPLNVEIGGAALLALSR